MRGKNAETICLIKKEKNVNCHSSFTKQFVASMEIKEVTNNSILKYIY